MSRSLVRPFLGLVVVCCLVFSGSTFGLALWHRAERQRTATMTRTLDETVRLNVDLRGLMHRHSELAQRTAGVTAADAADALQAVHLDASARLNRYLGLTRGLEERHAVESVRQLQAELAGEVQRTLLRRRFEPDRPVDLGRVRDLTRRIERELDALSSISAARLRGALDADDGTTLAVTVAALAGVGLLAACLAFLVILRRRVLVPLRRIGAAADRIAGSDFERALSVDGHDELAHLARRMDTMRERLGDAHGGLERAVAERTAELEEAHDRLLQSEKMSAVGRLVGGVAHELNNPLTAIMGYADLAYEQTGGMPIVRDQLRAVQDQAERSRRIVADLLQFARQRPTSRELVDFDVTVRAAADLWRHSARTAEVELVVHAADEPCRVVADRYKLQQVVLALLNNAGDAAAERGASPRIELVTDGTGEWCRLRIEDNGPGVAEPDRVFEPFYTTKEVGRGTGLGLSICYGIVEEHGGELTIENRSGAGAVATVRLPRAEHAAAPVGEATVASPPRELPATDGRRVLVVDDEPHVLEVERQQLERLGLTCRTATNGADAIRRLERESFDLVLTDLRMPGRPNGLGLYEWIRAERPELSARVLFVTGDLVHVEDGEPLPAPHLLKPFDLDALREAIAPLLGDRVPAA